MFLFEITAECKSKDGIISFNGCTTIKAETAMEAIKKYHRDMKGLNVFVTKVEMIEAVN